MKTLLVLYLLSGCCFLGAATLLNESFNALGIPAGWTVEAPQPGAWSVNASNYAGGTANEARLNYTPSGYGTYRLISPPIDTRRVHDMTLSFRHMFDHYDPQEFVSIGVELGHDTWAFDYELWYLAPTGDIPATQVSVPISFDLGMDETTYISFRFTGNNWNINSWYIDDILLTYDNTLGSGTWETGEHYPVGNLIIPDGHTLILNAGTTINFNSNTELTMQGRLLVNGTASLPVTFSSPQYRDYWNGIKFTNVSTANDSTIINYAVIEYSEQEALAITSSSKIRISNSKIRYNSSGGAAVIYMYYSYAVIENCDIYDNYSSYCPGLHAFRYAPVIRNNRFYYNTASSSPGCVLYLDQCSASGIYGNQIYANYFSASGYGVMAYGATGTFKNNLINNNQYIGLYVNSGSTASLTVENCDITYNGTRGYHNYSNTTTLRNNIIWGNGTQAIYNQQSWDHINISYCCFNQGSTYQVIPTDITNCIHANPEFVNPPAGSGSGTWNSSIDWHVQYTSPCIDAGDPASPPDPDLSRADMGMYPRALKPLITRAEDVPYDQGRHIFLRWNRNDLDTSFVYGAAYLVYRLGDDRNGSSIYVSHPSQITPELAASRQGICWNDGLRTWTYLTQQPAAAFPDYECIVSALQDSSSAGTHEETYMVMYYGPAGVWESVPHNGYSVDNIPPYAPARVDITHLSGDNMNLSWDEVTEGGWEGNSYPEINLITYKIYAGDTPDFEITPSSYLMSTTDPSAVLTGQAADRRFYRILATDSE